MNRDLIIELYLADNERRAVKRGISKQHSNYEKEQSLARANGEYDKAEEFKSLASGCYNILVIVEKKRIECLTLKENIKEGKGDSYKVLKFLNGWEAVKKNIEDVFSIIVREGRGKSREMGMVIATEIRALHLKNIETLLLELDKMDDEEARNIEAKLAKLKDELRYFLKRAGELTLKYNKIDGYNLTFSYNKAVAKIKKELKNGKAFFRKIRAN